MGKKGLICLEDIVAGAAASYHYRLRQIDLDGGQGYSATVELSLQDDGPAHLSLYPNPADRATVVSFAGHEGVDDLLLLDAAGRVCYRARLGGQHSLAYPLALDGLPRRVYTIMIVGGDQVHSARLVVE
ncbi:MAG: hypothetical protein OHK0039_09250 [Bacteroidia bacterium]